MNYTSKLLFLKNILQILYKIAPLGTTVTPPSEI